VSAQRVAKGVRSIEKLVTQYTHSQLDFLKVCGLVRKIFQAYDFDGDGQLDKAEQKALLDGFYTAMCTADASQLNPEEFRDRFLEQ
jgi:hypothetical protein